MSPAPNLPPATFDDWKRLLSSFFAQLIDQFGASVVAQWWFEVWNEPNLDGYWRNGNTEQGFARYLDLYRATSEVVVQDNLQVKLGGPTVAWVNDFAGEMDRFLEFLRQNPMVKCDFLTFHRKGSWDKQNGIPDLSRIIFAAEETAKRLSDPALRPPQFIAGTDVPIVNDEADMRVGFDTPFLDRMNSRFAAWLTAVLIAYDAVSAQFSQDYLRFLAASDNANLQLVQRPFDGVRSIMTIGATSSPGDLFKIPAYGFYELLRLIGGQHGMWIEGAESVFPNTEAFWAVTFTPDQVASLYTVYPRSPGEIPKSFYFNLTILEMSWPAINVAWFAIDDVATNAFTAAGGALEPNLGMVAQHASDIRRAQELAIRGSSIERNVAITGGSYSTPVTVHPYTVTLLWITRFTPDAPATPTWIEITLEQDGSHRNVILRWTPNLEPFFYTYRLFQSDVERPTSLAGVPTPLRAAMWVDTAPPSGKTRRYGVSTVSASGVETLIAWADPLPLP